MTKLFVVSDVHSFYTPFRKALNKAGFDLNNENHWLIVCGDCFDRGDESEAVLHFLMSLKRKILIKGNHDIMLMDCCLRGFPCSCDLSNGTYKTIQDIAKAEPRELFTTSCKKAWGNLRNYRASLVNYFETQNYIFVHSWIPVVTDSSGQYSYDKNWREASNDAWGDAMWFNPFDMHMLNLNQTGKTIVFGHWHCSAGHKMLGHCTDEFDEDTIWEPCFAEGIIGIDRCTAYTNECNVIVLEDKFMIKTRTLAALAV